jgi:putative holliday junction resolvase
MPAPDATLLAFDFGTRRIGVAVGNTIVRSATPLTTIDAEANEAWQPARLVVGVPVHADGREHEMTMRARRFARQLAGRFSLPVVEVDERYTTQEAKSALSRAGRGGRAHRGERDEVAAQLILQAYFDARHDD